MDNVQAQKLAMKKEITVEIKKHVRGGFVQVYDGKYAGVGGRTYFGYDPTTDPHALRETFRDIRAELDSMYTHDCPERWPRGEDSIVVTMQSRY